MAKLIIGCGYLGLRVARLWRQAGSDVFVITRSSEKGTKLAAEGLLPMVADVTQGPFSVPGEVETALFSIGFERAQASKQTIHEVYAGGVANAIVSVPRSLGRFIYISSTGVYGQVAGHEVDEDSPCQPTREGGQASLAAERVLLASEFADRSIILRLAGLYGPGRIPRAADLLAGKPIDAPATGFLNLIHVDDAARIILLAEAQVRPPALYVVSDGQPVVRGDYYRELARLHGGPAPKFIEPPPDSPAAARAGSDKRVNPRRLLAELKPALLYPNYREGLAAIVGRA